MLAGTNEVHGKCLSKDDIKLLKRNLAMPDAPFYTDQEAVRNFRNLITTVVGEGMRYGEEHIMSIKIV